jgi:carbamoyl-phosphate synthase small subunit
MQKSSRSAYLILEDGRQFLGELLTEDSNRGIGEVVFTTGMTGYPETLTDPSFAGQIIVFTYPLIGNYGVPPQEFWESATIHAEGVVLSTLSKTSSHHQSLISLKSWLDEKKIPLLAGIDTRALTRHLRSRGTLKGKIERLDSSLVEYAHSENLVERVSCKAPLFHGSGSRKKVIAIDCGMKSNILRSLLSKNVDVLQVPFNFDFSEMEYDGLLISNGPGDPSVCTRTISIIQKEMQKKRPIFGICLGAQLMALAAGAKTMKLPFGHRGQNVPCQDVRSNLCYITSQNHGYAVVKETLPKEWEVSFLNLNDGSVEGIRHKTLPYFAVQFHPEASPGPYDTSWLFEEFIHLL